MLAMLGVWAPPLERSRMISLALAGSNIGTVVAQPLSGLLCASNVMGGWPSVFYIFGMFCLIVFTCCRKHFIFVLARHLIVRCVETTKYI